MQNAKMKQPSTDDILSIFNASGLKTKLIFTFAMIAIFRLGVALPIFGIDNEIFSKIAQGNNIIGFIDLFSGGALANISILALGIGPYITASIIMQLLTVIVPHLEQLQKEEGEAGRRKISQYTRYFTVFIAFFQATIFLTYLLHQAPAAILPGVNHTVFFVGSALILTAGSVFVMWLAELMTERGIGNGGSLLIFVGIISRIPYYFKQTFELVANDTGLQFGLILLLAIFFATMVFIGINAHQWLFAAIYKSFETMPPGMEFLFGPELVSQILHLSSSIFSIGISMILPIFCVMFVAEVLMGFMSKMMPQMNVFMVAIPLKVYVGIGLILMFLSPTVTYLVTVMQNYLKGILNLFG